MSLLDKLKTLSATTEKIKAENIAVEKIWYEFKDVPMQELREAAEFYNKKLEFSKAFEAMQLHMMEFGYSVFCYSQKVKVKEVLVIDEAIENI